ILFGGYARRLQAPDYPWGTTMEQQQAFLEEIERDWGGPVGLDSRAQSKRGDACFRENWARYIRQGASPGAVLALTRMNAEIDVRPIASTIGVPILVSTPSVIRVITIGAAPYV